MLDDLHVVTIVAEPLFYFHYLDDSCRANGINLEVMGYYNNKWKILRTYVDKMQNNEIVCLVDGFETICLRPSYELREQFITMQQKHQCKIIIAHHNKLNYEVFWTLCSQDKCQNTYINTNTCIGYVGDWKQVLDEMIDYEMDDHAAMVKYGNLYPHDILIDMRAQIFLCLSNPLREIDQYVEFDEQNKLIYDEERPFFVHGAQSTYLTKILGKLNYEVDKDLQTQIRIKYYMDMCKDMYRCGIVCFYLICFALMYVAYLEILNIGERK